MELVWNSLLAYGLISLPVLILFLLSHKKSNTKNLPPGPPGWPVFGNMFELGTMPHRTLAGFRQKYGPIIWLRLGSVNAMAILSAKAATELLKNQDLNFADRSVPETLQVHDYNKHSLALAPYGVHWRLLRRICAMEMFINKRINETVSIRRKCMDDVLRWIEREANAAKGGNAVEVTRFMFLAAFNTMGNLMMSRDLVDPNSDKAKEFFTAMSAAMEWAGSPNLSDNFPFLKWLDLQGLRRKSTRDMGKAVEIAAGFVRQRITERQGNGKLSKDFLDVLLQFEGNGKDEPEKLSENDINIFILEMFLAGTETTSASAEWALTELLVNPEKMTKAKSEIAKAVGPNRKLEETDIDNLPYLQAVVKEALRLHPPLPFLIPRKAIQDTNFMGYDIPKGTQVLVDAWAIGRDPEFWDDPLCFEPERFLDSTLDFKGNHYGLIPFGAGRRMCVGMQLGSRMLHFALGSMLHEFDWELDRDVSPKTVNMDDRLGITVRKLEPLRAIPRKCVAW